MRQHEIITEILLPAALPSIMSSFLMMYGIGWTYVAVVEATNAKRGLGFIINVGAARGKTTIVFAAIIVIYSLTFNNVSLGQVINNCLPLFILRICLSVLNLY